MKGVIKELHGIHKERGTPDLLLRQNPIKEVSRSELKLVEELSTRYPT